MPLPLQLTSQLPSKMSGAKASKPQPVSYSSCDRSLADDSQPERASNGPQGSKQEAETSPCAAAAAEEDGALPDLQACQATRCRNEHGIDSSLCSAADGVLECRDDRQGTKSGNECKGQEWEHAQAGVFASEPSWDADGIR